MRIVFEPIGFVENEVRESQDASFDWSGVTSRIILNERFALYTRGLEQYSHILVIFWMHRPVKKHLTAEVFPAGDRNRPAVGLFATRSPHRPNPAGLKLAQLIRVDRRILTVKGLDALDGSPVVDIKPYSPGYDSITRQA